MRQASTNDASLSIHPARIPFWKAAFSLLFFLITTSALTTGAQAQDEYPTAHPIGFLQQQALVDETEGVPPQFAIHRARAGLTGQFHDRISYTVVGGVVEPPDRTPQLVHAVIDFDLHPLFQVQTGQLLVPFGLEGPEAIPQNPAIERAASTLRNNPFTMLRDLGVMLHGSAAPLNYAMALVNGAGANATAEIKPKDLLARAGVEVAENLTLSASGHAGRSATEATNGDHLARYRWGVDAEYDAAPLRVRAELMNRYDESPEGDVRSDHGGYLLGAYRFANDWEAVGRADVHDPDSEFDDQLYHGLLLGANYYLAGDSRFSINYELRNDELNPELGHLLTVQMQLVAL